MADQATPLPSRRGFLLAAGAASVLTAEVTILPVLAAALPDGVRALGLPHNVGLVWTDGGYSDNVTFEAFDKDGKLVTLPAVNETTTSVTPSPGPFTSCTSTASADLKPGTYTFYCRFHKAQGMQGTLVVK